MVSATQIKPRIKLTGKAVWCCADAYISRSGRSFKQAYDRWLAASLRDAMAKAYPVAPKKPGRPRKGDVADLQRGVKMPSKVRGPDTGNPASPTAPLRQAGTAIPQHSGHPITIKAQPKVAPIKQPKYHASMVRQMPSPMSQREYVPSADLQRNMARAAEVQQPLISISSGDGSAS